MSGGTNITGNSFVVSGNGTYTVFAKDSAGNISLKTIDITNIDMEAPETPILEANSTVPTNKDVTVTITYPNDVIVKEFKIGSGAWQAYVSPVVISVNETVFARGKDAAGNWSEESSLEVSNIDREPPADANFSVSTTEQTNQDVTVTINYPNDSVAKQYKIGPSGVWTDYTSPVVMTANETLFARSQDAAGNWSAETNVVINNIDKEAPEKPTIAVDNSNETNTDVQVTISYPSDAKNTEYRLNGGAWTPYTAPLLISQNSKVEARSIDTAGNISEVSSLEINNIDKEKPVITLTPSRIDPVNTEINVNVGVIDNNPIVEKKWAKGNQSESHFLSNGTDISGESFNVSENGTYTVFAKDSAGNISIKSIDIANIDMEAPVIVLTPSKVDPANTEIDVNVEVTDYTTVVERKWAAGNQSLSHFATGGNSLEGNSFVVSENGTFTVYAKDSAGNESVQTIEIINIDMEAPVISLSPSKLDPVNTEINVDVEVTDYSAIVSQKWAKGNHDLGYFQSSGTEIINSKFIVSENDIYTVYAKDSAGNESIKTITISNIDIEAPVITLTSSKVDPVNTEIDVSVDVVDNNQIFVNKWASGNQDFAYFQTGGNEVKDGKFIVSQNGIYTVYAKDSAGNESLETIEITNIDMDAPVIVLTPSKIDPVNTEIDVSVEVVDNNPIIEKKWAIGIQDISYFQTGGTEVINDKFIVSVNGIYTVFAKDSAGNESLQTIEISNIDMDAPDAALIEASTTAPTNQDVEVTITYSNDVIVREYKIGTGAWQTYSGPISVSSNDTVYARGKDAAGNWSEESSLVISNIDKIAPVIAITGVSNGETFVNEVTPIVSVEDLNKVNTTILLNGETFTGGAITESGSYILTIVTVDEAGNESRDTVAFYVNHSPTVIGNIPDKTFKKFEEESIDLSEIFKDKEDNLTYSITSTGENVVSTIVKDGFLHIQAVKQGSATLTIIAHDGFSEADPVSFNIEVNSVAPTVSLTNDQTWIVADGEKLVLEGTVKDPDKEEVVITATINGVEKSVTILTTGEDDAWSIEFDGVDIGTGVHSVSVNAKDPFAASVDVASNKFIVKVPVPLVEYEPILSGYEADIQKDRQDFTEAEHNVLLDAFLAVESLKSNNNPDAWLSVKPKVDLLADGAIKSQFYKEISGNALDYLTDNLDTATKSDYETAGFTNVQENLVPTYNEKNAEYKAEKGELTNEDVQLIIDIVNLVDKATNSNSVEDWKSAKAEIEKLLDGALKDEYLQVVKDGIVKAIEVNPSELTADLIGTELGIDARADREADYQKYLRDELAIDPILTKERLENIISVVDSIYDLHSAFEAQPTQENLTAFENAVQALTDGDFKEQNISLLPGMNLQMVIYDPSSMTDEALNTIGVTHNETNIPLYQDFLTDYLKDVAKEEVTKDVLQLIIDVVEAREAVKANPTDENIQKLLDLIGGLNPDASVIDELFNEIGGSILDSINEDFTQVTEKQLENIGIKDLNTTLLPEYQEALNEYANEKKPSDLTRDDIQKVVDAINGVNEASKNPSGSTIQAGYDAVNQLEDGPLKDKLLQELEDITVEFMANNPNDITQALLDQANLTTDPNLLPSYQEYFKDVLPNLTEEVTKEKLQELIDAVNDVWAAYHEALSHPSKANVIAFESLANGLEEGTFKTKMVGLVDDVALAYLIASPSNQEADDYARLGITINEDIISSYNANMEKYIKDIGSDNFTFNEVQQVITVTDKVETALSDSKTANVQQALLEVQNLQNGSLKNTLNAALNGQVIGDINLNPGTITPEDLENIGVVNVNPDFKELYQDALTKLKEDLGGTLTFEDIQNAVDAVNAVEKALETGSYQDILDAFDAISKLPDGSLKDALLAKLQEESLKEVIENPSGVTIDLLVIGGFDSVDSQLEKEYRDALKGYEQPLTKEAVQKLINVVNQVKKTLLDLTQEDVNKLGKLVDELAVSETKDNLTLVKDALKALLDAEHFMNYDNVRDAFDKVALVKTSEKSYLEQMANSLSHVRTALGDPSDEAIAAAQQELLKLENGGLKERMQSRVGGAYLEHVITSPGSTTIQDWINAGFENVMEENFPIYKGAVDAITTEIGQLTKEQIQDVVNAINAMEKAKKNPTNQTIQDAKEAINKVIDSQLKSDWLAEMEDLWKSIQPKPDPLPTPVPVPITDPTPKPAPESEKPPVFELEELPKPSEMVMVSSNEYAAVVMSIPKIEVAQTDSLKVKIKVSANDILEGSKLYLYANSASLHQLEGTAVARNNPLFMKLLANQKPMIEIDFGKLGKGTIEVARELVFDENGDYLLKGIFIANGTNIETNTVKVSVYKELLIPNTVLPNQHGLPVATLKAKQDIPLFKKDKDGNFVQVGGAKAGTLHLVYDTEKGYYKLADGLYAQPNAVTVHIGKGEIRKDEVNVYDKNGRFVRTLKKGQQYKVYSFDNKRYSIGGGEYIEVQEGVTFVFGWITVKEPMTLYKPDGTAERTLKAGERYRVYRADGEVLHLGGGYTVKRVNSKYEFQKN
ncbi:hypothetical protein [Bacillus sp. FJAT-29937]|uniref:hypothetical protein n=1 Tax=Bacillus sp. FJAT-29937 TaxID=1720553 RepID=UPI001E3C3EDA|nr:hypothetical protein [Bacillus sp. FJAT-29937]